MRTRSSGDLIAGKYRLEKPLARGGMGEVWTARNLQLDVPVAIKLMSEHALSSADLVARFEREARAAAQLRHANVVTIFEHGVFENVPFMAMELLDGEDLSARIKRRGRLAHAEALPVVSAVCKALRRAHEMGVIHRDLKPANIFLARQDEDEIVKVLDFGIAKLIGGDHGAQSTKAGGILGTPHYMPPEQAHDTGARPDHRSDLWSLGVIAFRMLTGKLPFSGPDPVSVIVRICREAPPAASSLAPDLDAKVDAFFVRALSRNPADRFQSAREFGDAFAALGGTAQPQRFDASRASASLFDGGGTGQPASARAPVAPSPPLSSPRTAPGASSVPARGTQSTDLPTMAATSAAPTGSLDGAVTLPLQRPPQAQAWVPSGQPPLRSTLPLGLSSFAVSPRAAAPIIAAAASGEAPSSERSPGSLPDRADRGAGEMLVTSSDAGTITRANTESVPRSSAAGKRNNVIVIGALFAAVLAVAVVGWTVISVAASPEAAGDPLAIPMPPVPATAPLDTATANPTPSAPAPTATATPSAPAPTASGAPSAVPSASAKPSARPGGSPLKGPAARPADLNKPQF